jgi:hypothetical protein
MSSDVTDVETGKKKETSAVDDDDANHGETRRDETGGLLLAD